MEETLRLADCAATAAPARPFVRLSLLVRARRETFSGTGQDGNADINAIANLIHDLHHILVKLLSLSIDGWVVHCHNSDEIFDAQINLALRHFQGFL